MANIPAVSVDYKFANKGRFYRKQYVWLFDWGKKIYTFYNGGLVALIPISMFYASRPNVDWQPFLYCNMAGYGKCVIKLDGRRFFATPTDYEEGRKEEFFKDKGCLQVGRISLSDALKEKGFGAREVGPGCYTITAFVFTGNYEDNISISNGYFKKLWADRDGIHFELSETEFCFSGGAPRKIYYSKEECMSANKIHVIDFDDEDDIDVQMEYTFTKEIKIKADSREEAEAKFNKLYED